MTEEESNNKETNPVKFTVLDPKKTTGKDIVEFWIAEMGKLADAEKAAAEKKNVP